MERSRGIVICVNSGVADPASDLPDPDTTLGKKPDPLKTYEKNSRIRMRLSGKNRILIRLSEKPDPETILGKNPAPDSPVEKNTGSGSDSQDKPDPVKPSRKPESNLKLTLNIYTSNIL